MGSKLYYVIFWLTLMYTSYSTEDQNFSPPRGNWKHHTDISKPQPRCKIIQPTSRDIVRRIYAILPYFDREHQNAHFLHKYRGTINKMSESDDMLNRDAAFYAAVLTPIMFLQRYGDARCLLERFQRALDQLQTYDPSHKREVLKHLQNWRDISNKVRVFVSSLPVKKAPTRTPSLDVEVNKNMQNKNDIQFLKELIKNLG